MMEPERLLLIFERSPEDSRLRDVSEAIAALQQSGVDVKPVAQTPRADGLVATVLRFWFPYLWSAGITGVSPSAGSPAEAGEFLVLLVPGVGPKLGTALGVWLEARYGRKVRVRLNDIEIEAQTPEQAETLWPRLEALRQSRKAPKAP